MDELAQFHERELRALMTAGLDGDAGAYHQLLGRLTSHLRAYYRYSEAFRTEYGHWSHGGGRPPAGGLITAGSMTHRHTYDRSQPFHTLDPRRSRATKAFLDYLRRTSN